MKKEELKLIVYISISAAAILTIIYLGLFANDKFEMMNVYRGISFSITAITFFWTFYFSLGWKLCLLNKLFYRPNLNGTWIGQLSSDWTDENGTIISPIEFFIVIRQSFLRIHFTTFTKEFVGLSYAETFSLDKDTGLKTVAYMYRKDTSQINEDSLREGAAELRLILSEDAKRLEGKYWSNTKTQGKISVSFINHQQVDSFESAKKLS